MKRFYQLTKRGVIFVEFSVVFLAVVIILIFVTLSGLVFLNLLNSYVVAKNFYLVFRDSELNIILEGTEEQGNRIRLFVFTNNQPPCNNDTVTRCINCTTLGSSNNSQQNNPLADLYRDLCAIFTSSKGYFTVFQPINVQVEASRLTSSPTNSFLTVTSRFNFVDLLAMLNPLLGSTEQALVSFVIRGVTL